MKFKPVIGSRFDPAVVVPIERLCIEYWNRWRSYGPHSQGFRLHSSIWMDALDADYASLLICDLAQKFALPMYQAERPANQPVAKDMQTAVQLGRAITEGLAGAGDAVVLRDRLSEALAAEEDMLRGQHAAWYCISIALCCIADEEDIAFVLMALTRSFMSRSWRLDGINEYESETHPLMQEYLTSVTEVVRSYVRRNFMEAEGFAHEKGCPPLRGGEGWRGNTEEECIVLGTLIRYQMLLQLGYFWNTNPSPVLSRKGSLAEEAMQRIAWAPFYLDDQIQSDTSLLPDEENPMLLDQRLLSAWLVFRQNIKNRDYHCARIIKGLKRLPALSKIL